MDHHAILLVTILLLFGDVVTSTRSLSKEDDFDMEIDIKLMNKTIQVGTMLIRNISKTYQSRETEFSKAPITETKYRPNTYLAVARTKDGSQKYSGAGSFIKIENPKVIGQQSSAARVKLQFGNDSIEAGWRVDPSLYGDSRTRLYVRTDIGDTHCFNTHCLGFIQTRHGFTFETSDYERISIPGASIFYYDRINIIKNIGTGNWDMFAGKNPKRIGYWPSRKFTKLTNLADRIEWGGAAHSPPGKPLPPMGSGNKPVGSVFWDGNFSQVKIWNEKGQKTDAIDLESYEDNSKLYSVRIFGYASEQLGYVILYGGSGH